MTHLSSFCSSRSASGILATALSLLAAAVVIAGPFDYILDRDIEFIVSDNPAFVTNYIAGGLERVDLDLSLDGGATWPRNIAHGLPIHYGTNTYPLSLRVTPAIWTEQARVRVRTLWSATTNNVQIHMGDQSDANFAIAGIQITAPLPGATVYSPSYTPIQWREAGVTHVTIGVSTNGIDYEQRAYLASPNPTGSWTMPIVNLPTGPLWICVQGLSNLYDIVEVNCVNLQQ